VRLQSGPWALNLSTTHQGRQFADEANTLAESADGSIGEIPGVRLWNAQASWKVPGKKGLDLTAGVNNLMDRRYFTRTVDGNLGKLVGAPRTIYVQGVTHSELRAERKSLVNYRSRRSPAPSTRLAPHPGAGEENSRIAEFPRKNEAGSPPASLQLQFSSVSPPLLVRSFAS
jgi:hypothetical protein